MIIAVKVVFTAATVCYGIGLWYRHRDNRRHRILMGLGFLLTLSIAVVLLGGVYVFGATYAPAPWLVRVSGGVAAAGGVLVAHRALATVALLTLIVQIVTGLRRHSWHHRLPPLVIALWLASYLTGLFIFV